MRNAFTITTLLAIIIALYATRPACAGALKSANDCAVGKRVATGDGHKGKITRVDRAWSYYALRDDTGKEVSYLYSLLSTEDSSAAKDDGKLVTGKHTCCVGSAGAASGL